MSTAFILASASPRREELLSSAGLVFSKQPSSVEEHPIAGEDAPAHVLRLARAKAQADIAQQQQQVEAAKAQAAVYAATAKAPEAGSPAATLVRGPQA